MRTIIVGICLGMPVVAAGLGASAAGAERAGLIGHWTFDKLAGNVAPDASGAGHDAVVHGASPAQGRDGGALGLDGKDDFVALGDLGEHEAVTIAFWMKADQPERTDWQGLVTSDAWEEGVLHIPIARRVVDVYLNLGERGRGRLTSSKLRSGTWYHVAVTADTRRGTMRLLTNGVEEDMADISQHQGRIKLLGQVVGREFDGTKPARYFRGAVDDVRIYSRALSAAEIRALCPDAPPPPGRDGRNIRTGLRIPDEGYCDQPYVVVLPDGSWLATLTTGPGREGDRGQHVVSTTSRDRGRTWTPLVDIEPSDGPEASWIVPLAVPGGRVYGFYTYNGDDVHTMNGKPIRADVIGWYAYKYTDDGGRTWSKRFRLPLRLSACDRANNFGGKVQIFWGIDKPNVVGRDACFAFTKLGRFMLELGEGWLYRSDNILTERDPEKLHWELLPQGDHGVRSPEFGSVQEEHNLVPLEDGSLYCVYRTTKGHPCHATSRDGGRTWSKPEPMTYTPGGRMVKTPRACPMLWRTAAGRFLFWFHNNGFTSYGGKSRNPVWIAGGIEKDGHVHWSQPEILLYDPNRNQGMSYPDLIEQDGRYWVTETQKTVARVHEIDKTLLEGLWTQGQVKEVARKGLALDLPAEGQAAMPAEAKLPKRLDLAQTGGLSIDFWIKLENLAAGQVILDGRGADGRGIALTTAGAGAIRIELSDGRSKAAWDCDPGLLEAGTRHHVAVIVDAGPGTISFVVDGVLCDGGPSRTYGWGRYEGELGDVTGSGALRVAPSLKGRLQRLRIYDRYLRTSEAVANFHAGP